MKNFLHLYKTVATLLLTTTLLFLLVCYLIKGALDLVGASIGKLSGPVYSKKWSSADYTYLTQDTIKQVWNEFDNMGKEMTFTHSPYATFQESPRTGKTLNIINDTISNYRSNSSSNLEQNQKPVFVWMFGGSSVFGWGLPDNETIPAHLQKLLSKCTGRNINVVNYGHAYYWSTMESVLFSALLQRKEKSHIAIFLDGFNDVELGGRGLEEPLLSNKVQQIVENYTRLESGAEHNWLQLLPAFPPSRLGRLWDPATPSSRFLSFTDPRTQSKEFVSPEAICQMYSGNIARIDALSTVEAILPFFFLQPTRFLEKELKYGDREKASGLFQALASCAAISTANFHDIKDSLATVASPVYLDTSHYNDRGSRVVAQKIADVVCSRLADQPSFLR